MPTPPNNSGLRDNHTRVTVADFLPDAKEQVHEKTDLELITWLAIKGDIP